VRHVVKYGVESGVFFGVEFGVSFGVEFGVIIGLVNIELIYSLYFESSKQRIKFLHKYN
jgi:hypothetical protein